METEGEMLDQEREEADLDFVAHRTLVKMKGLPGSLLGVDAVERQRGHDVTREDKLAALAADYQFSSLSSRSKDGWSKDVVEISCRQISEAERSKGV